MKIIFTTNTSNTIYEANETMTYCWKFPFGDKGKRVRISKGEFLEAQAIHEQEQEEALRRVIEQAEEDTKTEEAKEIAKKMAPRATKRTNKRVSKNTAWGKIINGVDVSLTAKQVDFILHLPDTNFWENGLDSVIWVDCLCDDIGSQFAGKPMTVGAMISTLCEKGLGTRGKDRVNGRKCTSFALTELGKKVAAEVGLK